MQKAYVAWHNGATLRRRRLRAKRYTFGDQWGDTVTGSDGFPATERSIVEESNHQAATNNIIRQLVKTVVGCYRRSEERREENGELMETDARTFEEYLISGCAIQRINRQLRGDGWRVSADIVSPARFFIGEYTELHGADVETIGQLHDITLQQVMLRHSHGDRGKASLIRRIYDSEYMMNSRRSSRSLGESHNDSIDFYHADGGLCRVIEVWTLETMERLRCHDEETGRFFHAGMEEAGRLKREQRSRASSGKKPLHLRWELVPQWQCRFFAPTGEMIDGYTAPRHPYVFKFYPLIDGEIHSFVEDLIEQQRNINRLLTLNDRLLSTAAKGVLLFPESQISRDMPLNMVAERWASPDGCVVYRGLPGVPSPQQLISSPGNLGVNAMVEQQMRLIAEVSGVSDAMKGSAKGAGGSSSVYESEYRNSVAALSDIFDSFSFFTGRRDELLNHELTGLI